MRLLQWGPHGQFSLTKDLSHKIPAYAILSHTWGLEEDEATFEEIQHGKTICLTSGHEKVRLCGEQAKKDGLHHFWVDTCCINRANLHELSKAINSMFRWYRESAKCYVYLADVSAPSSHDDKDACNEFETSFCKSNWFTRGWTLQELLAPASIEFFSREWEHLGSKKKLEALIHRATGIPISALQGEELSTFSVDQRLSWATGRKTTEPEDQAYCLLGIFNIFMPLIYGERENAFRRLEEEISKQRRNFGADHAFSHAQNILQSGPLTRGRVKSQSLSQIEGEIFRLNFALHKIGRVKNTRLPPFLGRIVRPNTISLSRVPANLNSDAAPPQISPKFAIPPADLQRARESNRRGRLTYWSHAMYSDYIDDTVKVHYSRDPDESESLALKFVDNPVLGIGVQWLVPEKSFIDAGEQAVGLHVTDNISLIVLASEKHIGLFHLALHDEGNTHSVVAPTLRKILESKQTLKTGVSILPLKSKRLYSRHGIEMRGVFDLNRLHNTLRRSNNSTPKSERRRPGKPINDLVFEHLGLPLFRDTYIGLSNWGRPELHPTQVEYAANDAYAAYQLFQVMDDKRLSMQPVPPLPECLPEVLKNQTTLKTPDRATFQTSPFGHGRWSNTRASTPPSNKSSFSRKTEDEIRPEPESPLKRRKINSQSTDEGSAMNSSQEDETLFVALDSMCFELAQKKGIPKYHVFHEKILRRLATERPRGLDSLRKLHGVGEHKLKLYGDKFLEVIAQHDGTVNSQQ